jgi:hypothetical protein
MGRDKTLFRIAADIVSRRGEVPALAAACDEFEASGCDPELELYACLGAIEMEMDPFADASLSDEAYVASVVLLRRNGHSSGSPA